MFYVLAVIGLTMFAFHMGRESVWQDIEWEFDAGNVMRPARENKAETK